ncbi:YmiA family putative membrane protein [Winslowiella toletana]|nr:YmiA family putative membrane protein [Winslowiella toletana]WNN46579.1 YmiA family putative membrane protein [Winslowiella toletana]
MTKRTAWLAVFILCALFWSLIAYIIIY